MAVASRELLPPRDNSRRREAVSSKDKAVKSRKIPLKLRKRLKKEAKLRSHNAGASLSISKTVKASKQRKKREENPSKREVAICTRCLGIDPVAEVPSCPGSMRNKCRSCRTYTHCLHRERCMGCWLSTSCAHHKVGQL